MSNQIENMDDLLDDSIDRSLRTLGFVFPRAEDHFRRLDDHAKNSKTIQPDRIKDPLEFLGKRAFKRPKALVPEEVPNEYFQSFAQAAREGKAISDEVKQKMLDDKLKARDKKKED